MVACAFRPGRGFRARRSVEHRVPPTPVGPSQRVTKPGPSAVLHCARLPRWNPVCQATRHRYETKPGPRAVLHCARLPRWNPVCQALQRHYETKPGPSAVLHCARLPGWNPVCQATRRRYETKPSPCAVLHCARLPGWNTVCQATRRRYETKPSPLRGLAQCKTRVGSIKTPYITRRTTAPVRSSLGAIQSVQVPARPVRELGMFLIFAAGVARYAGMRRVRGTRRLSW